MPLKVGPVRTVEITNLAELQEILVAPAKG